MNRTVSVSEIFDTNPFSSYQVWVCFLSFCIMFLEGFDMMIIGVALPKIADFLHSKPSALGLALSAGQVGPLVGAVGRGHGRRPLGAEADAVLSAIVFGIFTLMTAYITSVQELALLRFLAGIGLGGAIPNALAFGCEYAAGQAAHNPCHDHVRGCGRRCYDRRAFGLVPDSHLWVAVPLRSGRNCAYRYWCGFRVPSSRDPGFPCEGEERIRNWSAVSFQGLPRPWEEMRGSNSAPPRKSFPVRQ